MLADAREGGGTGLLADGVACVSFLVPGEMSLVGG
jgi:hypothetical protein